MQFEKLTGPQRVAILMLALSRDDCVDIFDELEEKEIRLISTAMSNLGHIPSYIVDSVCNAFNKPDIGDYDLLGDVSNTERILKRILPEPKAEKIIDEIRSFVSTTIWEKLDGISEDVLCNYLKNEHPQTISIILDRLKPSQASRIISILPENLALEAVVRMLCSESVPHQIVKELEDTLRKEFISNFSQRARTNAYKRMADIFNIMENRSGEKILLSLSKTSPEDTECIKGLMFTFDDLSRLRPEALSRILAQLDKDILPVALKGATKEQKNVFYRIMSDRAIRLLQDNIEALGSVRLRDVEKAKAEIVFLAKEMNENGEIEINSEENEMVIE